MDLNKCKRLHFLQHAPYEDLGFIAVWAERNGFKISKTRLFKNEKLPGLSKIDWLFIMGGPMNVYEEKKHPWLKTEKRFIEKAIKENKTIIGICLGAQLIANVLGARVFKNSEKEIGWFPVSLVRGKKKPDILKKFPSRFFAFHWHEDTFQLPEDAVLFASGSGCKNQGFISNNGKITGLQFHLEFTKSQIEYFLKEAAGEFKARAPFVQDPEFILSMNYQVEKSKLLLDRLLDNLYKSDKAMSGR
jgi:GMP synthase (glutamine-hydrolysing)